MSDRKIKMRPFFILKIIGGILAALAFAVLIAFAFGYFVMILWNYLMPGIFGLPAIGYWQAFCLILLAKIIFGHGMHNFGNGHRRDKWKDWKFGHHGRDNYDNGKWSIKGGWNNWKYYDDYWTEEGKEAFEKYIDRREAGK
jgi:hypothetical protein